MKNEIRLIKNLAFKAVIFSFIMILNQNTIFGQEFHGSDTPPIYTGGNKALKEFIDKNLIFPDSIKKAGIYGTVTVSYLIDKEGKVENVKLVRGIHPVCDSEAIRVTRLLTGWQAAINWGKPICFNVIMPIDFRLENNFDNKLPVIVNGTVTDNSTGKPIEGTLVTIKGTNIGTITDTNGRYKLEIPGENYDLEVAALGYATKTEKIGKNRTINVELNMEYYIINYNVEN